MHCTWTIEVLHLTTHLLVGISILLVWIVKFIHWVDVQAHLLVVPRWHPSSVRFHPSFWAGDWWHGAVVGGSICQRLVECKLLRHCFLLCMFTVNDLGRVGELILSWTFTCRTVNIFIVDQVWKLERLLVFLIGYWYCWFSWVFLS